MSNPLDLLHDIYPKLENGDKKNLSVAVAAIKDMQAELDDLKSSLERQPLPEAPASATVKVVDPATQMEWLLTFRFHSEDKLIESVARISGKLPALGVVGFDAYVDSRRAERQDGKPQRTGNPPLTVLPPVDRGTADHSEGLTFEAKQLVATVNEGKAYWKVRGGKFEKFGITVWPETLEKAGFFVDELNVMEAYSLTGWTATYTTKEGGKPDKIIGLAKAA